MRTLYIEEMVCKSRLNLSSFTVKHASGKIKLIFFPNQIGFSSRLRKTETHRQRFLLLSKSQPLTRASNQTKKMGSTSPKSSQVIAKLNLKPHQEGGFFSETFRDTSVILSKSHLPPQYKVDRPVSTCIYFLLPSGSVSHLHRIPCAETWHFYLGEPLTVVELNDNDGSIKFTCLGPDPLAENQVVQHTVPPNVWFGAFPTKDIDISSDATVKRATRDHEAHFSLVGCTCAPAFQFDDFELAKRSELVSHFPKYESLITMLTYDE